MSVILTQRQFDTASFLLDLENNFDGFNSIKIKEEEIEFNFRVINFEPHNKDYFMIYFWTYFYFKSRYVFHSSIDNFVSGWMHFSQVIHKIIKENIKGD